MFEELLCLDWVKDLVPVGTSGSGGSPLRCGFCACEVWVIWFIGNVIMQHNTGLWVHYCWSYLKEKTTCLSTFPPSAQEIEPPEKRNNLVWFLLDEIMAFSVEVLSLYVPWINRVNDLKHGDLLMMNSLYLVMLGLRVLESIPKASRVVCLLTRCLLWWIPSSLMTEVILLRVCDLCKTIRGLILYCQVTGTVTYIPFVLP